LGLAATFGGRAFTTVVFLSALASRETVFTGAFAFDFGAAAFLRAAGAAFRRAVGPGTATLEVRVEEVFAFDRAIVLFLRLNRRK